MLFKLSNLNSNFALTHAVHGSVACKPRGDLPIDLCGCNRALVHRFIMADDVNNVEKFSEKFTGLLFILNACLT